MSFPISPSPHPLFTNLSGRPGVVSSPRHFSLFSLGKWGNGERDRKLADFGRETVSRVSPHVPGAGVGKWGKPPEAAYGVQHVSASPCDTTRHALRARVRAARQKPVRTHSPRPGCVAPARESLRFSVFRVAGVQSPTRAWNPAGGSMPHAPRAGLLPACGGSGSVVTALAHRGGRAHAFERFHPSPRARGAAAYSLGDRIA